MHSGGNTKEAGREAWGRPFWMMLQSVCVTLPLGGCLLAGDKPEPRLNIPATYSAGPRNPAAAEARVPPLDWWRGFRSRELSEIIEEARAANLDIAAAVARIVQADATARIAGAPLLPLIDFNGNGTHSQQSKTTGSTNVISISRSGANLSIINNNLTATLNASYEIDFWGKNRSALRSAEQLAVASRFDREVIALTTVVAAANAYFQVLATQDRLRVAQDNLASAQRVLGLIQQRLQAGTASALDTAQQESLVNTQRAAIPPLEQTLRQNRVALAVLMARSPESVTIRGGSLRGIAYPRVTPGLPSELLTQRPDIREAEANLASANANVENARAQFLPSIKLTGEGGYESAVLKLLLRPESVIYTAAASLAQPIFHGGELLGNLDLQKGKQDELLQTYRKAVISGFADVENALVAYGKEKERYLALNDEVDANRLVLDLANQIYTQGRGEFLNVLDAERSLYQAEDALAQSRLTVTLDLVALYKALGGGWQSEQKSK